MGKLITEDYQKMMVRMHKKWRSFGKGSNKRRREDVEKLGFEDILDYGCGKGSLDFPNIGRYDPGVEEFSDDPEPRDLVVCTDVLEHIEPDLIDNVLEHIQSKMKKKGYFTIGLDKANKKLPDGRNAHLLIETEEWWLDKLSEYFRVESHQILKDLTGKKCRNPKRELEVICEPL